MRLGHERSFSLVPAKLLARAEHDMVAAAGDIGKLRPSGVRRLIEAISLGGMAMSVVRQTAPLSGWEHVISHYLDLAASCRKEPKALHGAQVGAATLISARAYERAWPELDLRRLGEAVDLPRCRRSVESAFRKIDPQGRAGAEIWRELKTKLQHWNDTLSEREEFISRKRNGDLDEFIRKHVRSSTYLRDALGRASAPCCFADLDVPIPQERVRSAVLHAHFVRSRFTLGDLLWLCGWLNEKAADGLLDEK